MTTKPKRKRAETVFEYGNGRVLLTIHGTFLAEYRVKRVGAESKRVRKRFKSSAAAEAYIMDNAGTKGNHQADLAWTSDADSIRYCRRILPIRVQDSKKRSKRKGLDFNITKEWAIGKLEEQEYRCLLTGSPFRNTDGFDRNPWAPSIDRIDSSLGYTENNCRIVCYAVNAAMNAWGEMLFSEMATRYINKKQANDSKTIQSKK